MGYVMTGEILGHYRVGERLGEGSWGVVYRAQDLRLGRPVALKILSKPVEASSGWGLFLREARLAARLSHTNIATVHDVGEEGGRAFIAMELVDGLPIRNLLPQTGFSPAAACDYAVQIAAALEHAHERGVVHGDLKSSNVLLDKTGHIKLVDFGLARRIRRPGGEESSSGSLDFNPSPTSGTLPYIPPEALRGVDPGIRGDVWAFGVVLYELCTGRLPFAGSTPFEVGLGVMAGQSLPIPESTPAFLRRVIGRCLEKDPQQRYASIQEILAGLSEGPRVTRPNRREQWTKVALSATLVVLAAVLMSPSTQGPAPSNPAALVPLPPAPEPEPVTEPAAQAAASELPPAKLRQAPAIQVWVNRRSGIYHCPGSRYYGNTQQGEYVKLNDAERMGFRPAMGKACE